MICMPQGNIKRSLQQNAIFHPRPKEKNKNPPRWGKRISNKSRTTLRRKDVILGGMGRLYYKRTEIVIEKGSVVQPLEKEGNRLSADVNLGPQTKKLQAQETTTRSQIPSIRFYISFSCQIMGKGVLMILVLMVSSMSCLAPCSASSFFKDKLWERRRPILSVPTASASSSFASSSIVLPLQGNVFPNGFYNVTLFIGQPPKPYFLDPDTGSDLTWLQCDAPCQHCTETPHPLYQPSNDLVPCKDPLCMSLHSSIDHRCENPDQCDYEVEYADGGSSLGVLVRDIFPLNLTNGDPIRPRLTLGCGYDQDPGSSSYHPMDGILGLGKGAVSIVSQLHNQGIVRNVVGHCFSSKGGGYLFFGDDIYDPYRLVWTPMSRDYPKHYSPGFGELIFNGRSTGLRNLFVVFDSGSSYTYFNAQAYQILTSLLNRELAGKPLREAKDDDTLPLCWRGRNPFKSLRDVRKYFKPLALSFSSGRRSKAVFEIPMESYLIISSMGNVCLGILNGSEVGLENSNIIGDISMQDKMVVYNNEKQAIGWAAANCDRVPKSSVGSM